MNSKGSFIISSDRSDSGKTTVTLGLMRYLSKNHKIAPFKIGPDFIDPMYHKIAAGNFSVNLDLWMMGRKGIIDAYNKYSNGNDLSIIEGVMGLYDGIKGRYSTWELSEILKIPIIIVADCSRNSTTMAAIIKGLKEYRNNNIKAVIFNKVASKSHYDDCKMKLPKDITPLGWIPFDETLNVHSRHLGLITPSGDSENFIKSASEAIENNIDTDKLLKLTTFQNNNVKEEESNVSNNYPKHRKTAAIAYDDAFSFYYRDNIELIRKSYEVEFFSPLKYQIVQDPDLIYIGGGYPELFLDRLQNNYSTKNWLKKESEKGTKIIAECGGMMYLSKNIIVEKPYEMTGIFDVDVIMGKKLTIGYTELKATDNNLLSKENTRIRGQEFHKSETTNVNEKRIFKNIRGKGVGDGTDGFQYNETLALYSHTMFSFLKNRSF